MSILSRDKGDAGFTVIEMLIAFTIMAIVAGSLFQMFIVASKNNAKAVEFDYANTLAITAAELFKACEGLDGAPMFQTPPDGAVSGKTWRSPDGFRYVKYYDADWREMEISLNTAGLEADAPEGATFRLEAVTSDAPGMDAGADYISASLSLKLDAAQNYRLVINDNAGTIEAIFNGIPQNIDKTRLGSVISVNVEYFQTGASPKNIAVLNGTGLTLNVNVFGVPDADEYSRYIEVSPVSGSIQVMYLGDEMLAFDSIMREMTVVIREMPPVSAELAKFSSSVYIPN